MIPAPPANRAVERQADVVHGLRFEHEVVQPLALGSAERQRVVPGVRVEEREVHRWP